MIIDPPAPATARAGTPQCTALQLICACKVGLDDPILATGDVDAELLVTLRQLGYADVTVLHPSLAALQRMREALGDLERDMLLVETEVLEFQPRRRYALWHDSGFFQRLRHAEERHRYVQMVQFALRPEGHLVITTSGPEGAEREHGVPVVRCSTERLAAQLGGQFELLDQVLEPHAGGRSRQLLHCRFQRHAPAWTG